VVALQGLHVPNLPYIAAPPFRMNPLRLSTSTTIQDVSAAPPFRMNLLRLSTFTAAQRSTPSDLAAEACEIHSLILHYVESQRHGP
jgi:hypothetical protein